MMLVSKLVIDPGHTIVAVAKLGAGAEEVVRSGRQAADYIPRPETARSDCVLGRGTFGNAVGGKYAQGLGDPGVRRFCGHARKTEYEVVLLVAEKGEGFVLYNRAAGGETVVFVALSRGLRPRCGNEER